MFWMVQLHMGASTIYMETSQEFLRDIEWSECRVKVLPSRLYTRKARWRNIGTWRRSLAPLLFKSEIKATK